MVWNYSFNNVPIQVHSDNGIGELYIDGAMVASDKVLPCYTTLEGSLPEGLRVCASVGEAIPDGCKVMVHGKALRSS